MGSVQQAVLEFDESVQAPWRPSLRSVACPPEVARPARAPQSAPRAGAGRAPAATPPAPRPRRPAPGGQVPATGPAAPVRPVRGGGCTAPPRAAATRPEPAPLRLTRRARRMAVALALGAGVAVGSWLGPLVTGGGEDGLQLVGESRVVVQPGDTLWSIAGAVAGDEDVRAVVDALQRVNHLDGTELVPGQVLELP
ncbi:LysM peptidoglycan-binding domain-containing protein [Geodermatophilus sp. SYSU D00691]